MPPKDNDSYKGLKLAFALVCLICLIGIIIGVQAYVHYRDERKKLNATLEAVELKIDYLKWRDSNCIGHNIPQSDYKPSQ